ncbi:C6 zinc finger domain-containing protein [Hirsutella rhossiliensis]|uniref:C6 zinc finger domain-containing protein n=1 Tax=Hirsutella rhossiliensis TaxID=111463 RepID=A0A9P8MWX1_9HYPO|nr:C6 zinc finger domain-containing protein [Hirsutella rhossiliensis]KAH0962730.1 C6 zinc finger domain-containing protein [Hirsutella rhossiliensis]
MRSSPSIVIELQPRPDTFDQTDMKLLWFYTTATCSCFSLQSGKQRPVEDIMRTLVVRHAFETPFLMHSLFALASLHLQSLGQSINPQRALSYRAKSFAGYRRAVQEAKPETFPALLANSLLLTVLSTQGFREPDGKCLYIIEWMLLWQGIGLVAGLVDVSSIPSAGLEPLFHRPAIDMEAAAAAAAAAAIPDHLVTMVLSMEPDDADFLETQTYLVTLQHLGSLYYNLRKGLGAIMTLRIITWLTYLPRRFVELVRSRRPRALVIMVHYAAFLKVVAGIWWMAGVGDRSIRDILDYLGHEWRQHVEMPLRAMDFDDATELARVISGDFLPSPACYSML